MHFNDFFLFNEIVTQLLHKIYPQILLHMINLFSDIIIETPLVMRSKYSIINFDVLIENAFSVSTDIYLFLKYFLIPVLLIFIVSTMLVVLIRRYALDKIDLKKSNLENQVNMFLTDLIFSVYTEEEITLKINHFKKEVFSKKEVLSTFVFEKLIHIKQNVQQMNQEKFILIYEVFGFNVYTEKLIKSRDWRKKSEGFLHYQILDYKLKKELISPYLKSKNTQLRSNALVAMISLSDKNLDVLDNSEINISRAEELKILDILYQKEIEIPTNIHKWLNSKNDSIVIIALKLMLRYKYILTENQLTTLLNNANYSIRKETIITIRDLHINHANDLLIQHYQKETSVINKILILKTFQKIGNANTKNYTLSLLSNENNLDLKFEIVNCIFQIDQNFFSHFIAKDKQEEDLINRMLLHHKNPFLA